jgi:hypothetical protein
MAKLPRTGVAYRSPDEREVTLAEIVASLGLKPLSKKAEREIRDRLGFALATWDEPYTALQIKDIAGALKAHAKRLDQIAPLGTITRSGFAREHDIAVGGQLIQILASNPAIGSVEAAHEYLRNFCDRASITASSCVLPQRVCNRGNVRAVSLAMAGMMNLRQCYWTSASRTRSSQLSALIAFRANLWGPSPKLHRHLNIYCRPRCARVNRRRWSSGYNGA